MLVLGREVSQKLRLIIPAGVYSDDVEVNVVLTEIRNAKQVRLGVEAPRFVQVVREELLPEEDLDQVSAHIKQQSQGGEI